MNELIDMMGLVRDGRLRLSVPSGRDSLTVRLTRVRPQEARAPESNEIDLSEYEGRALMVRGYDQSEWIYDAVIVDVAGLILTAVVERLTGLPPHGGGSSK